MPLKDRAQAKGQEVLSEVKSQVGETADLARSAATSSAWLYPLKGAAFMLSHREILEPVGSAVVRSLIMSAVVLVGSFVLFYFPQAAFLSLFSGPLGFIAAVPLVLSEAYVIILALSKFLFLDGATEDVFDATLLVRGHEDLVGKGRSLGKKSGGGLTRKLGSRLGKPLSRFSAASIARYIISLPLNAIPGLGTGLFLLYNGSHAGPSYHDRYFELKKTSTQQREQFVKRNQGAYTAFGVVALALNLVPVVGLALALTTSVGAALWASDIEKSNTLAQMGDASAPAQRQVQDAAEKTKKQVRDL